MVVLCENCVLLWSSKNIPEELKKCSNYERDFYYPSKEMIMKYAVVVATLTTAGRYALLLFPVLYHFIFSQACILHFGVIPVHGTISVARQSGKMYTAWRLGRMQCIWWCPCVLTVMLYVYIVSTNLVRSVVSLALHHFICICNK